ncbi:MAG: YebC/PmpR family DNA-binding transcriptional regulator, partial [Acidimicrobiales bacterium]
EDDVMTVGLDAGLEDLVDEGDTWRLTAAPADTPGLRSALEEAGIAVESSDVTMLPKAAVPLDSAEKAKAVLRLIDELDEHDDVQDVYANFDIPDDVLQAAAAD